MIWYKKYLTVYEKPFNEAPLPIIEQIKNNLQRLQNNAPLVSVIIIAYNEENHLLANLWSLSENQCRYPLEIFGIDNNSSDHTAKIYQKVAVPYYIEHRKGPGFARNCGLGHAKGKYCICIDADTMYPPYYIETMTKNLEKKNIVGAFSLWSYIPDRKHSWLSIKLYEFLRDNYLRLQAIKRPELCVRGMVFAHDTEKSKKIGGFRTDIIRGEDGSLALELKKFGKLKFIHNRKARPVTGFGTVDKDGSFFDSFKTRAIKAIKGFTGLFTSKKIYKDEESNLIN